MQPHIITLILTATILANQAPAAVVVTPAFGVVYDNMIDTVNNGRVNATSSPFGVHADGFTLGSASVINGFEWLGGYKGDGASAIDDFVLSFYDIANGVPQTAPFAILGLGDVSRELTGMTLAGGGAVVYSYFSTFPDLSLDAGSYLVAVVNDPDTDGSWLWADRDASPGQSYIMGSAGAPWREFSGNGVAEFAFSISYVPEPSALTLLFGGCVLLAGSRRRPPLNANKRMESNS